ncbi:class II fructose-bisphosphate aldolase [[Mycoplasma] testudinis]|uniref:class II fructose-bisphosphate aldolase n=1 Tax=[Mycoplasma] testudinis TaxID=33924 RepID=UPI000489C367|nr:class II fructose-bisphosphate aldolase [[Mycoplasma] testudinis]
MKNIEKIYQLLSNAKQNKFAIGGFNYDNALILRGIIAAAEQAKKHVFIMCTESASKGMEYDFALANALTAAKKSEYVISHWDHGYNYDKALEVINDGWNSVMYDGSKSDIETNIKNTKHFIEQAEKNDVWTECEIGTIGGKEDDHNFGKVPETKLEDAIRFAAEVKARMMGIAVGNLHGVYPQPPHLNFDLIKAASEKLHEKTFLVLHGCSGIPVDQVKKAVSLGMVKVNYGTDLKMAYTNALHEWIANNPKQFDIKKSYEPLIKAVQQVVFEKIKLLSSI